MTTTTATVRSRPRITLAPTLAKPLAAAGGVLAVIAALLPWTTFVLFDNDEVNPSLQYFDAPFALSGYRLHTMLLGLAVLVVAFVPRIPGRARAQRALGFGIAAIGLISLIFLSYNGGGVGTVTAADGDAAFGAVVALVAGVLVVLSAIAAGITDIPDFPTRLPRLAAYGALVLAFAAILFLVAETLTAGGRSGVSNPYAGPTFLAFLGMAGGVLGALSGVGVVRWISALSERHRAFSIIILVLCALSLPLTSAGNAYWMTVATTIGVYAATAIGLNVVVGLAGLLDLGYVAFMGVGAFVAANLSGAATSKLGIELPFPVAALIAAILAGIVGAIVGSPTLRVRGDYLAIVTLAFGEIFTRSAQNDIGGLTGGSNAIPRIPDVELGGTAFNEEIQVGGLELPGGVLYYFMIVLVVGAVMAVFANLKNSRAGRAWIAIREDEDAARAMGIRTGKAKIMAFLVGATLAGLAGAIFAHKLTIASFDSFKFLESVTLLAAVILGGMGTIPGAVLGASLLFVLPEKLREFDDYRLLLFGLALILIMRFRPQGLVPDRVRRAELAGETATGKSIDEEEALVVEQEHDGPTGKKGGTA
ncbi:branched-chain amino acid ABC transporter permease [Actinokineospora pegani]|uniref:branched-chain amino acid ABC transporter permease n=1 Tax=Actinokineospora pegani TaxID=2654637 RepID=UPI0012EAE923|nr:branched-chain amino acid ABC transporter permease [Actinokineospora pegani]